MYRAVLTLLAGLMLSLVGGVAFSAPQDEITLRITGTSWIELIHANGDEFITKLMRNGEVIRVKESDNLYLSSGNAGAVQLELSDGQLISIGRVGEIDRDVRLNTSSLKKTLPLQVNQNNGEPTKQNLQKTETTTTPNIFIENLSDFRRLMGELWAQQTEITREWESLLESSSDFEFRLLRAEKKTENLINVGEAANCGARLPAIAFNQVEKAAAELDEKVSELLRLQKITDGSSESMERVVKPEYFSSEDFIEVDEQFREFTDARLLNKRRLERTSKIASQLKPRLTLLNRRLETFCFNVNHGEPLTTYSNEFICDRAVPDDPDVADFWEEKKRRGLTCVVSESGSVQTAAAPKPSVSSAELSAAQKEAQRLREELVALKAKQEEKQQTIAADKQVPLITIISSSSNGPQGRISGRVTDNTGVGEVRVDGQLVSLDSNGNFAANTYVPDGGISIIVEAFDLTGLSSSMSVRLNRDVVQTAAFSFDRLNPLRGKVAANPNALALIIGVAEYKETSAPAVYADTDAKVFADYASEKLGVPRQRIKTLVNDGADEKDVLLAAKRWLARGSLAGQSDVYVFFAGHGLASDDGEKMYLLPYDGAPELLDKTAILRDELFADIAAANPRSVTVFLDTCYSGTTRGPEMLIASRPISIRAKESAIPEGFTVMTAAAGDQTAKPLEEAKHGMFSYFLMKGMEGDADANQDNQITAGELHAYVQQNVIRQSSGSQTPEIQGDANRVLVRFQ